MLKMKSRQEKIRYLDGFRLKNAIIAGGKLVEKMQEGLNKINVFPVPDGDTGTNMALTMSQISVDLAEATDRSVSAVSLQLAESALMGAQGNSGAILAQFFHGFAEGVKGKLTISTSSFAVAVQHAKISARSAMSHPKEGTILTVIEDFANYIELASRKTSDFNDLLKNGLKKARESLAETPKKLEVLRKANVVDAGAQGFVHLLEGIVNFIDNGKIQKLYQNISAFKLKKAKVLQVDSDIKFRFCTECILEGKEISRSSLNAALAIMGDSLIIAGGKNRVRVHIHTNHPEQVFAKLTPFGTISSQKIDDMWQQHSEKFSGKMVGKIGIVTDSSCDLPFDFIEENHINIIPVKIVFGNKAYLDKVDLSPVEFYNKLTKAAIHPKTSQPAMADIKKTYDRVAPFYEKIISIHLPRAVSGTLQSIERAAELFGDNKITSVDSKTISGALGLVVMEAAAAVKQELPFNRVIEKIQYAIENIHIYVSLPTLKYLVKGGRISASKGVIGKILNLNPIITFDEEGKVKLADKAIGQKSARQKTFNLISQKAKPYKRYKFIVAHANAPEKARWYLNQLKNHFKITEEIPVVDAAPALGVHTGPGTAGIAFIGYYD